MIDDLDIPTKVEREYLAAFGAQAIYIATSPTLTPCVVGISDDLGAMLEQIRASWHWSIGFASAFWVGDAAMAQSLIDKIILSTDAKGRFVAEASDVQAQIERAAAKAGVILTRHDQALGRVRSALALVDSLIEGANAAGELSWFNAAYRDYRLSAGEAAMDYSRARGLLRRVVVRRLAAGDPPELGPGLLGEVFPGGNRGGPGARSIKRSPPLSDTGEGAKRMGGLLKGV